MLTGDIEDRALNACLTSVFNSKTGLQAKHAQWRVWKNEDLSSAKHNTEEDLHQTGKSREPESLHPQMLKELVDVAAAQLGYP